MVPESPSPPFSRSRLPLSSTWRTSPHAQVSRLRRARPCLAVAVRAVLPSPYHTHFQADLSRHGSCPSVNRPLCECTPQDVAAMLAFRDRREAGVNAPAHGLLLWRVFYRKSCWFLTAFCLLRTRGACENGMERFREVVSPLPASRLAVESGSRLHPVQGAGRAASLRPQDREVKAMPLADGPAFQRRFFRDLWAAHSARARHLKTSGGRGKMPTLLDEGTLPDRDHGASWSICHAPSVRV